MIGQRINNYTVTRTLGEGGMGTVYAAEHDLIGLKVAVKILRREFAGHRALVARFINEARAAHAIRHPNIVEILDAGTLPDGRPYLMMELLTGSTLGRRLALAGRRLSLAEALGHAGQVAAGVGAAHDQGIVHRDLKPENIFLVPDPAAPGGVRVKVLDFGVAKLKRELTGDSFRTGTGLLLGTPPYMSPEQCRGLTEEVDHRSDIYALGIILYQMLCGEPPFFSRGYGDLLMMHMSAVPRPPRALEPTIPLEVEAAILKALEKNRARRFASMRELQRALGVPVEPLGAPAGRDPALAVTFDQGEPGPSDGRPRSTVALPRTTTSFPLISERGSTPDPVPKPRNPARRWLWLGAGVILAGGATVALRPWRALEVAGGDAAGPTLAPHAQPRASAPAPGAAAPTATPDPTAGSAPSAGSEGSVGAAGAPQLPPPTGPGAPPSPVRAGEEPTGPSLQTAERPKGPRRAPDDRSRKPAPAPDRSPEHTSARQVTPAPPPAAEPAPAPPPRKPVPKAEMW